MNAIYKMAFINLGSDLTEQKAWGRKKDQPKLFLKPLPVHLKFLNSGDLVTL